MKKYIKMYLLILIGLLGVNNAIANNTLWETRSYKYPAYLVNPFSFKSSTFLFAPTIKANNDLIKTTKDGGTYAILANDTFDNGLPGQGFVLTGTGKNTNISQEGTWPTGITINANGQLVIANNAAIPLGKSLEYKICTLTNECSSGFITFEIPIEGKTDSYMWNTSTTQYPIVVANDVFKVNHVVTPIVLSGSGKNVSISAVGVWPSGITLDVTTGFVNVTSGTAAPSSPLEYKICVDGTSICQNVKVVFLKAESPHAGWNPGSIKIDHQYVCYNGTALIQNDVMGSGSILEFSDAVNSRKYSWEISFDGGLSWKHSDELLGGSSTGEGETGGESASGSVGTITVDKGNSITITNVTNDFYVRRKASVYKFVPAGRFSSYTAPILVKAQKENEIQLPNDVNSFALASSQNFTLPTVTTYYKSNIEYFQIDAATGNPILVANPTQPLTLAEGTYEFLIKATTVATGGNSSTAIAPRNGCETTAMIKVMVYDPSKCWNYTKRTFATDVRDWTSGLSGVEGEEKAVNGNRANYATITGGVVILGIGTVGIDLYFTKLSDPTNPASPRVVCSVDDLIGKKVVIKLGEQYSGLKLAGGMTAIGRYTSATNPSDIGISSGIPIGITNKSVGTTFGVKGGVLDLLKGDNVFEFSFIPAETSGKQVGYNGVRIQLGSLLGVADLGTVFYAYIEDEGTIVNGMVPDQNEQPINYCEFITKDIIVSPPSSLQYPKNQRDVDVSEWVKPSGEEIQNENIKLNSFVEDAFWGNYSEVLNVASSLSSVVYPYYAVDDDYDSYTLFNATAGVLNRQFLRAQFRQLARPGDQIQITLAYPNLNVLNLSLLQLGNFKLVYYLKGAKVGEERLEQFRVLDLGLFRFRDKRRAVLSKPVNFMFDAVELQQFNTVSVNLGDGLHVHDIRINPLNAFVGMEDPKQVTQLCAIEPLEIQKPDVCTTYELSFARVTEFGGEYLNPDGSVMKDFKGNPIKMIKAVEDIANSTLAALPDDPSGFKARFDLNLTQLFTGPDYDGKLLIKVQTKRQDCKFGGPQYLRVEIENCAPGFVNPVLKSNANY